MAEPNLNSFSDFPEDVQFCILSFLSPTEIANFACTSKRYGPLCQSDSKLWHSLCDRRWGSKTQINKWGNGQISYKLLYKTLNKWENLIGFWRRCGQSQQKETVKPPSLVFFEWGSSFLSGWRVSPSQNAYSVIKSPFLWISISPEGEIVNYLDPEGQNKNKLFGELGYLDMDVVPVNVNFIGDSHFSVEENVNFAYRRSLSSGNLKGEDNGEDIVSVESGSPGSLPETFEIYQYYANRMSPGADRAIRRQRRREKEKQGKKRWETEHFLKIVDSSPTLDRPLQGLWKGICEDMKLEFYLVAYDEFGISCRRVGDLSERRSSSTPVFWTSDPTFVESPFPTEEEYIYDSRIHIQPPEAANLDWKFPLENDVVSRIMYINSSYDLVILGVEGASLNPWRVEGRVCVHLNSNRTLLLCLTRHVRSRSLTVQSSGIISRDPAMASNSVRVAAVQMTSINDLAANFATCSRLAKEAVAAGAKLVCFPESFSFIAAKDGESVKLAEPLDGPIMQRYCLLAREAGIWLSLGGFQEKGSDDAHLRNTHVIIDDSGNIRSSYSKIHLFDVDVPGGRVYKESSFTEPGNDIVAVDSPVGRLGLSVCYDLRFPELYQQLRFQHEAQILLVPSAFTTITGQAHWEILLRARAIETQCYVIAAAQAGKHNEKRESYGDTLIIDPWGTVVGRLPDRISTGITVADIDFSLIDSVRAKIPIAKQRKLIEFWKSASL